MDKSDRDNDATASLKSCGKIQVPTEEEVAALNAMRKIKARVRELKKKISEMTPLKSVEDEPRLQALEEELAHLKGAWEAWAKKREEATRVRMILLGHEEGQESDLK